MKERINTVPIFLSTDDYYATYASVAIQTIIENSSKDIDYLVYVLNSGLSKDTQQKLNSQSTENIEIKCVDVSEFANEFQFKAKYYFSVEMFYRILIPKIFKQYDKVIYIDCDVVCRDDLYKLYDSVEFDENTVLAACLDCGDDKEFLSRVKKLGIDHDKYINSGVLVMNSKEIREQDIFKNIDSFLKKNKDSCLPDQDAINHICKDKIKILDTYWNIQTPCFRIDKYKKYVNGKKGIIHFTGVNKPWDDMSLKMSEYFWCVAKKSPFYEIISYRNKLKVNRKKYLRENINTYFDRKSRFTDKIVIISAKDDASKNIKKFINKSTLGIDVNIKFRESYICVIDVNRNRILYEQSSKDELVYGFASGDKEVKIVSGGFNASDKSSIKINDVELSKNKRGLNFVILTAKDLSVVDTFFVDTHDDEKMIVRRY